MRKPFSFIIGLFFISNIAIGTVIFDSFLNWYDTGQFSHDGWHIVAMGGFFFGCLALVLEVWFYSRYKFWPQNSFLFFGRMITFNVAYIALSFAVSSGVSYAFDEMLEGGEILASFQTLLIVPFMAIFYSTMVAPFGLIVGIINGTLLKVNHLSVASHKKYAS